MVDDKVDRDKGIDLTGVAAQARYSRAHGCQVNHRWHTRKILHNDPARFKWQSGRFFQARFPVCQIYHILSGNLISIAMTQNRLQHDPNRNG
jgi:hypothetical protein